MGSGGKGIGHMHKHTGDIVGVISVTVGVGTRGHRGYQTERRLKQDLRDREAFPWPKHACVSMYVMVMDIYAGVCLCVETGWEVGRTRVFPSW